MKPWPLCALLLLAGCEQLVPPSGAELSTSSSTSAGSTAGSGASSSTSGSGTTGASTSGSSGSSGCGSPRCPETVLTGLSTFNASFEVHQGQLYWVEDLPDSGEALVTRAVDGGPTSELVFPGAFDTWKVVGGAVYWSNDTQVWRTLLDGGGATQIAGTASGNACTAIAVDDGGTVAYSREPGNGQSYDGSITEWRPGDGVDGGVVVQANTGQVGSMVLTPDWLVWADFNAATLSSQSRQDGGVLELGQLGQTGDGLAVTDADPEVLWRVEFSCQFGFAEPGDAGSATPSYSGPFTCYLTGAAADSNHDVYFLGEDASNSDGGLYLEPSGDDGGHPELLTGGLSAPGEVQLDGPYVYFGNDLYGHPEVLRISK